MQISLGFDCDVARAGYSWFTGGPRDYFRALHEETGTDGISHDPQVFTALDDEGAAHRAWLLNGLGCADFECKARGEDVFRRFRCNDSAVFMRVASMQPTMQEILDFANSYGAIFGERFADWKRACAQMGFAVDLWRSSQEGAPNTFINEHFKASPTGEINCPCYLLDGNRVIGRHFPLLLHGISEKEIRDAIKVGDEVRYYNIKTDDYRRLGIGPQEERPEGVTIDDLEAPFKAQHAFCPSGTAPLEAAREFLHRMIVCAFEHLRSEPTLERRGATYEVGLKPADPASAIWMQFIVSVTENKRFRNCVTCGRPFEVGPLGSRTNRLYCKRSGDACRAKALRQRKARARELHQQGVQNSQITKELGITSKKLNQWLKEK